MNTISGRSAKGFALLRPTLLRFALLLLASTTLLAQDGQWLMYSGAYSSHRFSPLTQLTPDNVAKLRPVWVYQPPGTGSVEATPVVAHGIMYVTSGPTMVAALDLRSGRTLWEWTRPIAASVLNLGFPRVNRGVAILDNTVYVGTLDGYLFALDATAGIERWSVHVGENPTGQLGGLHPVVYTLRRERVRFTSPPAVERLARSPLQRSRFVFTRRRGPWQCPAAAPHGRILSPGYTASAAGR